MRNLLIYFTTFLFNFASANAGLNPGWDISVGGSTPDIAYEQFIDPQGNIYITGAVDGTGAVQNFSGYFCGTVKISNTGNLLWFKRWNYSGPDSTNEFGNGLVVDNSGNVFVGVNSQGGLTYLSHIIKYDASGNFLWSAEVKSGATGITSEFINCMSIDDEGNVYASGRAFGQAFLSKISGNNGDSLWTLVADLGYYEIYETVYKNGFIYATGSDSVIVKVSTSGSVSWAAFMNIRFGSGDYGNPLYVDDAGNVYTTGLTSPTPPPPLHFATVKVNPNGTIAWECVLPPTSGFNYGYAVTADNSGNAYSTGRNGNKFSVMKHDASTGNILWIDSSANGAGKAIIYKDGSVIAAGIRNGFRIVEYDAITGNIIQSLTPTTGVPVEISRNGNLLYMGGNNTDFYCIELEHTTTSIEPISGIPADYRLNQNYPNPFNPSTKIEFSIPRAGFVKLAVYDISGKEVLVLVNQDVSACSYSIDFTGTGLSSGVYFYRLHANGFTQIKKMILNK